jgi:hypothetical protein
MKTKDCFLICTRKTQNCKDKGIDKECFCSMPSCLLCPKFTNGSDKCKGCKDNLEFNKKEIK